MAAGLATYTPEQFRGAALLMLRCADEAHRARARRSAQAAIGCNAGALGPEAA
jgi:hypothetical protein